MNEEEVRKNLQREVEQLCAASVGQTEVSINAKAIAIRDAAVQECFVQKLLAGNQFEQIRCLVGEGAGRMPATGPLSCLVIFEFKPADGTGFVFLKPTFAVLVDLTLVSINKIVDPYAGDTSVLEPASSRAGMGGVLPFALNIESNAPRMAVPLSATAPLHARQQQFFQQRGIVVAGTPRYGSDTDTTSNTQTWHTVDTYFLGQKYDSIPESSDDQTTDDLQDA